jgi:transposase
MRRTEALQGVRMAMFLKLLSRWESAELSQEEAAELLAGSERTFRRWTRAYEEEGEAGLVDRRLGKASGKRVPADRAEEVERLYRERYQGFTVKHFHEHLIKERSLGLVEERRQEQIDYFLLRLGPPLRSPDFLVRSIRSRLTLC